MAKIYFDKDVDRTVLEGKVLGIVGYGNQGRAQALNLRDSGFQVIIGNRQDASWDQAREDGFPVYTVAETASQADILLLLVPDEVAPQVYEEDIAQNLREGKVIDFASGYNITFGFIIPPPTVDVVMVAPRMIGQGVRDTFIQGRGFPSLLGIHQDPSGQALDIALAIAQGIGSTRMGAVMSSFDEETLVDLFSEHLDYIYAIRRAYEVLVEAGCSPEVVLLEWYASGEAIAGAKAIMEMGLWGQLPLHSRTSQYGQEVWTRLSPEEDEAAKAKLREVIDDIRSGRFAQEWMREQQAGMPNFKRIRKENLTHPMLAEEKRLYRVLGREIKDPEEIT